MNIFELMYVAWKRERQSNKLESLDKDYYEKIKPYILHLENQYLNEDDKLVAALFKRRWKRVNYILNDIISIRLNKHFEDSIHEITLPNKLPVEELNFRENLDKNIQFFKNQVLNIDSREIIFEDADKNDFEFLIFEKNEEITAIGTDFNNYGPFSRDDIVLMPKENLRNYLLKSKGREISLD